MTQIAENLLTLEEFLEWKPENERYELHNGAIVEMSQPIGGHEEVIGFAALEISVEIKGLNLPYFIPKQALVRCRSSESSYSPDVLLLNRPNLFSEPLWKKYSTVEFGASIPLVIEVVSTNWRDDYYKKVGEYEEIGILEYWIIDYLGLGGRKFIGNPKQPTISIYQLIDNEYQVNLFRDNERVVSPTFPNLNLTANQIFEAGNVEM
ncbi:MAG: Uma2 family endonuclease [Nostocales cyanobacterium 94392]|nr:Uma2 family endonuclease [Nostocales cyanobacterium 94392]